MNILALRMHHGPICFIQENKADIYYKNKLTTVKDWEKILNIIPKSEKKLIKRIIDGNIFWHTQNKMSILYLPTHIHNFQNKHHI